MSTLDPLSAASPVPKHITASYGNLSMGRSMRRAGACSH